MIIDEYATLIAHIKYAQNNFQKILPTIAYIGALKYQIFHCLDKCIWPVQNVHNFELLKTFYFCPTIQTITGCLLPKGEICFQYTYFESHNKTFYAFYKCVLHRKFWCGESLRNNNILCLSHTFPRHTDISLDYEYYWHDTLNSYCSWILCHKFHISVKFGFVWVSVNNS